MTDIEILAILGIMICSFVAGYVFGLRHAWKDANKIYNSMYTRF